MTAHEITNSKYILLIKYITEKKGKLTMTISKNAKQKNLQLGNPTTSELVPTNRTLPLIHETVTSTVTDEKNISLEEIIKERVSVGMVIKNYKQLCQLLDLPVLTSASKQAQIKRLKCYMDFEKSGQKFIITDIFDTPLTINDQRKLGNNSIYVKYIEVILIYHLCNSSEIIFENIIELFKMLSLVNNNYKTISYNELFLKNNTLDYFTLSKFYLFSYGKLRRILDSALKNMMSRNIITVNYKIVIYPTDSTNYCFIADEIQRQNIISVEREVLHTQFNNHTIPDLFSNKQDRKFYKAVNKVLYERYHWSHYEKKFLIKYIHNENTKTLSETEIYNCRKELNHKIINYMYNYSGKSYFPVNCDHKTFEEFKNAKYFLIDYLIRI